MAADVPGSLHHQDIASVTVHFNMLVQERRNSSALAMELRISCTNPSICCTTIHWQDSQEAKSLYQTLRKLFMLYQTKNKFFTTFSNFKHGYIKNFYWSSHIFHWSSHFFIGRGPRTDKFRGVCSIPEDNFYKSAFLVDTRLSKNLLWVLQSRTCPLKIQAYFYSIC